MRRWTGLLRIGIDSGAQRYVWQALDWHKPEKATPVDGDAFVPTVSFWKGLRHIIMGSMFITQDIEDAETRLRFLRMHLSYLPLPTL